MRVQPPREDLIELPQLNPLERFPDGRPHVPEGPGLGFALNEDAVRAHLVPDGQSFFEPAPEWTLSGAGTGSGPRFSQDTACIPAGRAALVYTLAAVCAVWAERVWG